MTLDADTILAPQTIPNLVRHFAVDAAGTLAGVAGVVRVGNREQNLLTRWQALEYLTQIGVERAAQDAMGAISIVPGACAAWRKQAISEVGGYSDTTLAEDCDLSLLLHRAGWRITQDDEALAFTEAPADVDSLLAQRTRWTYGTLQSIFKHRDMLFRRRYGMLGCFVLPNYILSIVMPVLFLPFITVMSVMAVQAQGFAVLGLYFLIFLAAHLIVAAVGIALMREKPHHLLMVPIYRVVYEPLRAYLLYTSTYLALRGVRMGWRKVARSGAIDAKLSALGEQQPKDVPVLIERTTPVTLVDHPRLPPAAVRSVPAQRTAGPPRANSAHAGSVHRLPTGRCARAGGHLPHLRLGLATRAFPLNGDHVRARRLMRARRPAKPRRPDKAIRAGPQAKDTLMQAPEFDDVLGLHGLVVEAREKPP